MFFHYIERYIEWIVRPSLNLPKHDTRDTFAERPTSTARRQHAEHRNVITCKCTCWALYMYKYM